MIILVAGATHTGKTAYAQKLLEKYQYPYLSIDHLKMGLIRSGICPYTVYEDEKLTDYLWPIVREMVKTAIENRQNLIVEGCYVPKDWIDDFDKEYLKEIRFVCLAMSDAYIDSHFEEIIKHCSDVESRLYDSDLDISYLKRENRRYISSFADQVILIENDYLSTIESLLT